MNKFMLTALILFTAAAASAQLTAQGTIVNTSPNKITVFGKPSAAISATIFGNINICLSIPDQGAGNPTVTLDSNFVNNFDWTPLPVDVRNGRAYYAFVGNDNSSGNTTAWTSGSNKIASFIFSNGNGFSGVQLNDETGGSPEGGTNGQEYWYVQLNDGTGDITNYNNKFYGDVTLPPVNNAASPSYVVPQPYSLLPVDMKDFSVTKQGAGSAFLSWTTVTEQNVSHFVIQRGMSANGGFSAIAEVKATGNSNSQVKYTYTDQDVYNGSPANITYFYRIASVDMDGKQTLSAVRSIRFTATGEKAVSIYPNPAREGFTLTIPLINPQSTSKILLKLVNRLGQVIHARQINSDQASNYYYDVKTSGVTNGEYMLQIILDGELLDTKKIIIQR